MKNDTTLPDEFLQHLQRRAADCPEFRYDHRLICGFADMKHPVPARQLIFVAEIEIQMTAQQFVGDSLRPVHLRIFFRTGMKEKAVPVDGLLSAVGLQRPPEPDGLLRMNHQNAPNFPGWCECPVDQVNPVVHSPIDRVPGGVR